MTVFVAQQEDQAVEIPKWVKDLSSFRRWARSEDFPHRGQYAFLNGRLWIDPSLERESYNQVTTEICRVLATLVKDPDAGRFYSDTMGMVNVEADLATQPDGMFLSYASLRDGRVRLAPGEFAGGSRLTRHGP